MFSDINTARLNLRRFKEGDIKGFYQYRSNPEVALYQGWEGFTYESAGKFVADQICSEPNIAGGWFQIAMALQDSDKIIGDCGLHTLLDDPNQVEIGYSLDVKYQKQGFAREALKAVLQYLFVSLNKHRVIGRMDVRNSKSFKLLEYLGFRREGHFLNNVFFKGEYTDEYLYAMLKEDWLKRQSNNYYSNK